jgi:hypothetical protein
MLSESRLKEIVKSLEAKGANHPCGRCEHTRFEVIAETNLQIQNNPNAFTVGGPSIPAVIVACANCGNISHHALGALGLKPQEA